MGAGIILILLVVGAATAPGLGRPGAVLLAAISVAWLMVSQPMEGAVLVVFSPTRGLTAADLGGLAGLVIAGWVWVRPWLLNSKQPPVH